MRLKSYLHSLVLVLVWHDLCSIEFDVYFNFDRESKRQDSMLKKKSELFLANSQTYNSIFAIKNQAQEDAKNLQESLKSNGYLDAYVHAYVDTTSNTPSIVFEFQSGKRYSFDQIIFSPPIKLDLRDDALDFVTYKAIENIEKKLLEDLENSGYFLASFIHTKIVAKDAQKADLVIEYNPHQAYYFGPCRIEGLRKVKKELIEKKIPWHEKDLFNASLLKELQKTLLDTQLFSQVNIKPLDPQKGQIPILIDVVETKFKTVSLGINYQTHFHIGGDLSFEHRNVYGDGQKLTLESSVTQRSLLGKLDYFIPNFYKANQTFDMKIEATREQLQPSFSDNMYEVAFKFEKSLGSFISYDAGLASRYYVVQHSVKDGGYSLVFPYLKWRYDNTYSQLDPKEGFKIALNSFFYQNLNHTKNYSEGTLKTSFFYSFFKKNITFAQRIYFGSFFTSSLDHIPVPLRFFGGTDEYLRGFKYYTVSPLKDGKPEGGRSCLFSNTEFRFTIKYPFGTVLFYDSGFVSSKIMPYEQSPYYQTLGFGLRYYAFFGPMRIDFGFPLNPRKNLDSKFKILASFGHTF
jgi:translocation and assembly module TamA